MPPEFIVNASSSFVLIAISVIILMTLASVAYPALLTSARIVTPSMRRRWEISTKPKGDKWEIPLPFTSTALQDTQGILRYLDEYFRGYSVETSIGFITRSSDLDIRNMRLILEMSLAPYDAGIGERVDLECTFIETERRYLFALHLTRLSGLRDEWIRSNEKLIDALRKEFLSWRALKPGEKTKYYAEG